MFAQHQTRISAWGRQSPENFARVLEFVLGTIRVHLRDAAAASRAREFPTKVYFGAKLDGLDYINRNKDALWADAELTDSDDALLAVFMRIPGIGPAKAGFAAQLLFGRVGCLDTHNIVRFGLSPREFRIDRTTPPKTKFAKIRRYIETCDALGGCEALWDGWCEYVAKREGDSPDNISRLHLAPLGT